MTSTNPTTVDEVVAPRAVLHALGGLTLEPSLAPDGSPESRALLELATRRRKVALLLYLAMQTKPVSRELLATLLWSEEPPERARHNLTEALSHIRRTFGKDSIATRVQDVELSATCPIDFDVTLFDAAIADGALERAAVLYAGPFLAGVFLDRAPAFDDWAARERARLSARFVALCRVLVPRLLAEVRWADAAFLAEKWLEEDLEDADASVALLHALASPGTRVALRGAIDRYRRLKTRLQAEFDSEPEERVAALSATHECALAALPARREADAVGADAMGADVVGADAVGADAERLEPSERLPTDIAATASRPEPERTAPSVTSPVTSPDTSPDTSPWRRIAMSLVGATTVVLCIVAWAVFRPRPADSSASAWVLVADTQDPAREPVTAASITMALGVALAQGERLNVVTRDRVRDVLRLMRRPDSTFIDEATALEIATRIGAGRVIVPSIARLGAQRALSARTLDVATGRALGLDQTNAVNDDALLPALDVLAGQLRNRLGASPRSSAQARPLPEVTTASLGALREYTTANAYAQRGAYDSAIVAYRRSIALDSNFATAHAAVGQLLHLTNRPVEGERSLARALSLRSRLSAREAMRNEALQARWRRLPDSAIAIQQRWLATYPLDRDTKSSLAYDLFQGGQSAAARDAYVNLLTTDSLDARDWINLAAAANGLATDADRALARRAFARAFALDPTLRTDVIQNNEYGSLLVRAGFPDSASAVFRLMLAGPPSQTARGYRSLGLLALWLNDPGRAIALFDSAARAHQLTKTESLGEVRARLMLAWARSEGGDAAGARTELERVRALARGGVAEPTVLYWAGKAMARRGMTDAAREMLDTLARRAVAGNVRHESASLLLRGEVAVAFGRGRDALPLVERGASLDATAVPQESLAYAARAAGGTARGDSIYRVLAASLRFGTEAMLAQQFAVRQLQQKPR